MGALGTNTQRRCGMSDVWVFPPEVNRQADFIKHIVIENFRLRKE
jgi:hypothetical protein